MRVFRCMALLCVTLVAMLAIGCGGSNPAGAVNKLAPKGTGFQKLELKLPSGETRNYSLFVPFNYDGKAPVPAIVFLHGQFEGGSDGVKNTTVGLGPAIKRDPGKWPVAVIFPQSPDGSWTGPRQHAIAIAALDDASRRIRIDADRVTLAGLSTGGEGCYTLAARHPDRFAALVPKCGGSETQTVQAIKHLPIWVFHNQGDPFRLHASSRKMVDRINQAGGNARLTSYGALGHNCWDRAYNEKDLLPWILAQKRQ